MKPKRKTGLYRHVHHGGVVELYSAAWLPCSTYCVARRGTEEAQPRRLCADAFAVPFWALSPLCCRCGSSGRKRADSARDAGFVHCVFCTARSSSARCEAFYYAVPQWDTILHTMSGAMLGALGFFHDCDFQQCGAHTVESFTGVHRRIFVLLCACDGRGGKFANSRWIPFSALTCRNICWITARRLLQAAFAGHDEGHHRGRHRRTGDESTIGYISSGTKRAGWKADDPFSRESPKKRKTKRGKDE